MDLELASSGSIDSGAPESVRPGEAWVGSRKGDWIQTYSGLSMFPLDPIPEEIAIEDIAHALSNLCRFTGHVRSFYSVAEHSVRVSWACEIEHALWGLLHDASEAYLSDISSPMKRSSQFGKLYMQAEANLMRVICLKFNLELAMPTNVKACDARMLATERRDLLGPCNRKWRAIDSWAPYDGRIIPQSPEMAKQLFLTRFQQLTKAGV
jgi:5'-deoxynucleotidase YfbR-like HD superfamily hydrolase